MLAYALRTAVAWRAHPVAAQGIIRLYATAAAWLFALVLITGIVSALVLVPVSSVLTTAYGLFLIAKAVLVGVAAGLAVAGQMWLRRPAAPGGPALVTRLEICALAAVLAITGVLTVLMPPAKPSPAPSALHRAATCSVPHACRPVAGTLPPRSG
jgi:copper transport protein